MILCKIQPKGQERHLGWWQFAVMPQLGELMDTGSIDLPDGYQVAAIIHKPVRREEVDEYRPPYVMVVVERSSSGL